MRIQESKSSEQFRLDAIKQFVASFSIYGLQTINAAIFHYHGSPPPE